MELIKYKQYAQDIVEGRITACESIKLACKRYLSFFERDDMEFKPSKVEKVVNFISHLKHYTGVHVNRPFLLSPYQLWLVSAIYGFYWKGTDKRVTRNAYIEVGRKNGKSFLSAALCLYHLIADGEAAAEVILAATSAQQALISFKMAQTMLKPLDPKGRFFKQYRDQIKFLSTNSALHIVASDAKRLDGFNCSCYLVDEYHAHQNNDVLNVLSSSVGMRQNPLGIIITTAGFNLSSPCYEMHNVNLEILQGKKQDDSTFIAIYTLDKEDDPMDEKNWIKSNPNLGVTVTVESIKAEMTKAKNNPTLMVNFLTKIMNIWVATSEEWIPMQWIMDAFQKVDLEDYRGMTCFMGHDLGATGDLTVLTFLIPIIDGIDTKFVIKNFYYLPQSCLEKGVNCEKYRNWHRQGYLTVTNGNSTNYDYILNDAKKWSEVLVPEIYAYDAWNSTAYVQKCIQENLPMAAYSQSIGSMNRPTKEIARLLADKKVIIDYNPITQWCFENSVIKRDWNDNEKVVKDQYEKKIDGVVAILMALGAYLTTQYADFAVV